MIKWIKKQIIALMFLMYFKNKNIETKEVTNDEHVIKLDEKELEAISKPIVESSSVSMPDVELSGSESGTKRKVRSSSRHNNSRKRKNSRED